MIQKIKDVESKVTKLLTQFPHLRDSDSKLVANIWNEEMGGTSVTKHTMTFCFFEALSSGKHTSPEAITRARRRVQEKNPFLRGNSYKQRKEKEIEVRSQIKSI